MQLSDPSKKLNIVRKKGRKVPKNLTVTHIRKSVATMERAQKSEYTKRSLH